ncbi:ATP-binding cassette subfamily B protein [Lentzea atacamensis]|uniref:ATP-binding cassette subfamily B protein n=1 Tax=Lentzea atacamensis TaxID=531938 RepID=A0A316HP35_9PSEU|nr:ABC transporter ATP-binding protein [Lentzea atacamensis]PWK81807.1 ATP-binding cassette subfamily B protein [Lentzea atacamensis]RAS63011.1 ATP-binding cassette subfamily B protein [Lentzea atacamensis]
MAKPGDALLFSVVRRDHRPWLLLLNAAVATTGGLLIPSALADAVDMALGGTFVLFTLLWLLGMAATEIIGDAIGIVLAASITSRATAWLRHRLSRHLLALGHPSPFAAGDAVSRVTGDCGNAGGIVVTLISLAIAAASSVGSVVALALMDWRLAAVFVVSVPLAMFLVRTHMQLTADDVLAYQEVSGDVSARLLDAVSGKRTIAAAGIAGREADRVLQPLPRLAAAGAGMWRTQAKMMWRAGLLLPAVEVVVLITAGFGVMEGRLSPGDVLAALGYAALGMGIVGQIPQLTALERTRASASRIAEVLDTPPPDRAAPVAPESGAIELRGAGVTGVLHDVNLTIPAGAFTAVVGSSGAGKSTLAAVLGGLSAVDSGEVLRDGEVGYAFERPALLGRTIGRSIGYGTVAGEAEVRDAAVAAQVHDVLIRLPQGYDTPVAEAPLSGGEVQRIGLARAIVRDPALLVLDDATASLDTVTEAKVDAALTTALPGRTRVVVTHRAATAARADLVVWLENGRVRGTGTHQELWENEDYRAVFTGGE